MRYNKKKALADNVNAIETALAVHGQGRQATDSEKKTLALYSGFGGIKEVLNIGTDKPMPDGMAEPMKRLQEILLAFAKSDITEYKALIDSIKSSVLTAFYTPQFIIDTVAAQIHATFKDNGMQMRTFLEPSAGIGGFLKTAMLGTRAYAFEKDTITGLILSLLHDNATTISAGYETIGEQDLQDKGFDVIASNIPFGNFRVFDADMWKKGGIYEQSTKTIHNYFFIKSMDLLNEGGILAFVTSRGIADTPGNKFVREYLVNHADLITALRLPDNIFMETGGIEVGTDLLVFQKHTRKTTLSHREQLFMQVGKENGTDGIVTEYANKLFMQPKTALATDSRISMNQFGKYVRKYQWHGEEAMMRQYFSALLKMDFSRFFRKSLFTGDGQDTVQGQMSLFDLFGDEITAKPKDMGKRAYTDKVAWWMKDGAMVMFEGQLGNLKMRKSSRYADVAVDFVPMADIEAAKERANDYFPIRETYLELSNKEREEEQEHPELRESLNALYDKFVAKWGYFHEPVWQVCEEIPVAWRGSDDAAILLRIAQNGLQPFLPQEPFHG